MTEANPVDAGAPTDEQTVTKPNPDLVAIMIATVQTLVEQNPDRPTLEILYMTVKATLAHAVTTSSRADRVALVFGYYLSVHPAFTCAQGHGDSTDPHLITTASLSLFDLYRHRPDDRFVRDLLVHCCQSLHEVIVSYQEHLPDRPATELLGDLTDLGILCAYVAPYIKPSRQKRNYGYIAWLKQLFRKALTEFDITFLHTDPAVKQVVAQVRNKHRVITV